MSAIVEKVRDYWERISPRERRIVVFAAIAAPVIIAIWLSMAIHDGLVAMEARNHRTRVALTTVEALHARGAPVATVDDNVLAIPAEPISLETYLDKAAHKAETALKGDVTPHPAVTRNGFVTNTVSCQLDNVSIEQLKAFLQEIETASKFVMVTHLELRRDFKAKDKLDATLEVSTYSREPVAKGEGSASGSGGSGGAGSGSAKKGS